MDTELITAKDELRAPKGRLLSAEFRRMLSLSWPHRRFIIIGVLASAVYAVLHTVGIFGMLPVLKVMLTDEGLHGWVDLSTANERLGVKLRVERKDEIIIDKLPSSSALSSNGYRALDAIVAYRIVAPEESGSSDIALQPAVGFEFIEKIRNAESGAGIILSVRSTGDTPKASKPTKVNLKDVSWKQNLINRLVAIVPRAKTADEKIVTLVWVLSGVVLIVIISNVARFFSQYYIAIGVLRAVMDLRRTLYRKVLRLPMSFFGQETSDIVSRFVQDAQEIQRGLIAVFGKMLREPLKAICILSGALYFNAAMTITMLVVGPVIVLIFWAVGRKIRKANKRLLRSYGIMIGALSTTLSAIGVVKAYNAENIERKHLWQIDRKMFRHQLRIAKLEAIMRPALEVLGILGIAIVVMWFGSQLFNGKIQLDEFTQLLLALGMLLDPLRKVADVYPRVMRSSAGAARIYSVIDSPEEVELAQGAVTLNHLAEKIEFRDISFTYPGTEVQTLKNVSITINKGETVAIVGPNGSGKTTLTKLLVRFYDPDSGEILFDGTQISQAQLRSLRQQISMVSQDPVVFAMTIAENIAYGARNSNRELVIDAARRAHADEFIRNKPNAYDEMVGEQGSTLSGGQRQRICIARAMMRNAPILIFDEATSQIDSESEQQIQDAVKEFATGRTTILIAHRLSTIRFANRIIVMNEGKLADVGTHEELLSRCPLYATICQTQLIDT